MTGPLPQPAGVTDSSDQDYPTRGHHHRHEAAAEAMPEVARAFRDAGYSLEHLTCLDERGDEEVNAFTLTYQFNRPGEPDRHLVSVRLDGGRPAVSIAAVFPGADWYEREVWDMHGVAVEGHPDLKRILMPEEYSGHPLRKDFVDEDPLRHQLSGVVVEEEAGEEEEPS